jgi:hypothetical protein
VNAFRGFELEALRLLLRNAVTPEQMRLVETFSGTATYRYTGSGYFLTISDQNLPIEKATCHVPAVVGNSGTVQCGFVAFLSNHELTLECHTWGPQDIPDDFRDQDVVISTPPVRVFERPNATQ